MSMRGTLFIVAAPSGAGKSSIVNAVLARDPQIRLSISFTSRAPRPGERHAEHYHFVSAEEFQRMIDAGDFFEYARVHGDWKGTARQSVEPQLAAGHDVLLEIDWQGAAQVRAKVPDAVSVFILPPSRAALEERMRKRGQDSEEVIQQRLAAAREDTGGDAIERGIESIGINHECAKLFCGCLGWTVVFFRKPIFLHHYNQTFTSCQTLQQE